MQSAIVVKGRLINPTIVELDEPVTATNGNVEVLLRLVAPEPAEEQEPKPLRSLYGLWQDAKLNLSAEEIDEARREILRGPGL
ncbi:MAG TPA: hypothetical protein PLD20_11360 [Blastocatellia bacterium]|nr:hypothetical protein [Blastocatellia bacterium]HMV86280.1 hypothetical protein [Blastocatellia bacterium]HMX30268.1 hypothetical protein [Blastocatellia bacterium]HMY75097.1 hypothetical protein [Blastocatellia bacterium]HMZ18520.1 hypothetical protein [Blastocatellia bacterium]